MLLVISNLFGILLFPTWFRTLPTLHITKHTFSHSWNISEHNRREEFKTGARFSMELSDFISCFTFVINMIVIDILFCFSWLE